MMAWGVPMRRSASRRRTNFRTPELSDVERSVDSIIRWARDRAATDHGNSFASAREADMVTEIYLSRAHSRLKGLLDD